MFKRQSVKTQKYFSLLEFANVVNDHVNKFTGINVEIIKNIINFIKAITPNEIQVNFEKFDENSTRIKFLLNYKKHKDYTCLDELSQYCNGLIFEVYQSTVLKMRYLCIPMKDFTPFDQLKQNNDPMEIYEIQDGSTFNMYYDYSLNKWLPSMRRIFDATNVVWRGQCYGEIIAKLFEDNAINIFTDATYANYTFTFGFSNENLHPFKPRNALWFIQTHNNTPSADANNNPNTNPQLQKIKQKNVNLSLNEIKQNTSSALNNYLTDQNYTLGYIIRSNNNVYLVESTLLNEIRKLIYQLPKTNKTMQQKNQENFKNFDLVILESYMDFRKKDMFIRLFPQYSDKFAYYENLFKQTVDNLSNLIQKIEPTPATDELSNKAKKLANFYYPIIKNTTDNSDPFILRDLIIRPKYAEQISKFI